jgi:hypothetical protein
MRVICFTHRLQAESLRKCHLPPPPLRVVLAICSLFLVSAMALCAENFQAVTSSKEVDADSIRQGDGGLVFYTEKVSDWGPGFWFKALDVEKRKTYQIGRLDARVFCWSGYVDWKSEPEEVVPGTNEDKIAEFVSSRIPSVKASQNTEPAADVFDEQIDLLRNGGAEDVDEGAVQRSHRCRSGTFRSIQNV